jgi:phage-related protein
MEYEVQILESATKFLRSLTLKLKAKAYRTIRLLEEFGPFLAEPHSKKIKGYKFLYELRVKQGSNICRFFYFHQKGKVYIVTSGYLKKDRKTSKSELVIADKIMKKFMEKNHE